MANKAFLYSATLYNVTGKTADENSSTFLLGTIKGDEAANHDQDFAAAITVTTSGGASSPTADVIVQTSADGTNWVSWVAATQVTTATTQVEIKQASSQMLAKYVRVRLDVGGGTAPTTAVRMDLLSTGKFTATAQS